MSPSTFDTRLNLGVVSLQDYEARSRRITKRVPEGLRSAFPKDYAMRVCEDNTSREGRIQTTGDYQANTDPVLRWRTLWRELRRVRRLRRLDFLASASVQQAQSGTICLAEL